jgi:hypothetical protein
VVCRGAACGGDEESASVSEGGIRRRRWRSSRFRCLVGEAALVELVVVEVTDSVLSNILSLVQHHSLRGFDAIHLCTALWFRKQTKAEIIFVCSDHNLLAAAEEEGFGICNPEQQEKRK